MSDILLASSSNIDIYPWSSEREPVDRHVLSEENLKLLWSNFTDFPSYVLSDDITNEQTKFIKFVMHGYYFYLSDQELLNNPNLWVTCAITISDPPYNTLAGFENSTTSSENPDLASEKAGTDFGGKFTGLNFSTTAPAADSPYDWLRLIETTSEGTKRVPITSKFKFSAKSIASINGGTV